MRLSRSTVRSTCAAIAALSAAAVLGTAPAAHADADVNAVPARIYTLKYVAVNVAGHASPLTTPVSAVAHTANLNDFYQRINGGAVTFVYGGYTTFSKATQVNCDHGGFAGLPSASKDPNTDATIAVYATGAALNCPTGQGGGGIAERKVAMFNSLTENTAANNTFEHEVGHALGLQHSDGLTCAGTSNSTTGTFDLRGKSCSSTGYASPHSVMGGHVDIASPYNLGANQMLYLGGLRGSDIYTATGTATYTINGLLSGAGRRAILIPTVSNPWVIEYRPASGTEIANTSQSHPTYGTYPGEGVVIRRLGTYEGAAGNNFGLLAGDAQLYPTTSAISLANKPAVFHPGATITLPDGSTLTFGSQTGTTATITITRPADTTGPQGAVSALPSGYSLGNMNTLDVTVEGVGDNRSDVTVVCKNNGATVTVAKQVLFAYNEPTITCAVPVQPGDNRVTLVGTDDDGNSTTYMDRTYTTTSLPGAPPPLNPGSSTTKSLKTTLSKNTSKKLTVTVTGKNITRATSCRIRTRTTTTSRWKTRTSWRWAGTKKATITIKKGYVQARCGDTSSTTKRFT